MARSRTSVVVPVLPLPPAGPESSYMNQLVRTLTMIVQTLSNPGEIRGTELVLTELPGSGIGQPTGTVYADEFGVLRIVLPNVPNLQGMQSISSIGDVTVTT